MNITLQITLNDETRSVEFQGIHGNFYLSGDIAAARIGQGVKLHRTAILAVLFDSTRAAGNAGYDSQQIVTDAEGRVYGWQRMTNLRGRPAQIVQWADEVTADTATRQNYYGSI